MNHLDKDNHTPLSLALLNEKYFCSKVLILKNADVNIGGGFYGSCINISTVKFQFYIISDLLKYGENPN